MQVTVSLWYVVDCEICAGEVERITRAAIRDIQVTKLSLTPGHRHNHNEDAVPQTAAVLEAAGQQTLPGVLVDLKPPTHYAEESITQ
jgi:hypothetical protein